GEAYIGSMTDTPIRLSRRNLIISGVVMATGALTSSSSGFLLSPRHYGEKKVHPHPVQDAVEVSPGSLDPQLFRRALAALDRHSAQIKRRDRMAIIDFSAPSS